MIKTFRHLLLVIFISFSTGNFITFYLSHRQELKCAEIRELRQNVQQIQTDIYRDFKVQSDFFYFERSNPQFYISGKSQYAENHIKNQKAIRCQLVSLLGNDYTQKFGADSTILSILDELMIHTSHFRSMVYLQLKKGFKDYGTEGQMRIQVHIMENSPEFRLSDVLMLRRHEKDYLLRSEAQYPEKLHRLANEMVFKIERTSGITPRRKDSLRLMINNYVLAFDQLVLLDNELGMTNNTALKQELDKSKQALADKIALLLDQAADNEQSLLAIMRLYNIAFICTIAVTSIIVSIWLSRKITARLEQLSVGMQMFVASGFSPVNMPIDRASGSDEIGKLIGNYLVMREKIIELLYSFKLKVEERTEEITSQRDQLEKQSEEIATQRDNLAAQNKLIDGQKRLAELHNNELMDSLRYASGIQQAMMPAKGDLGSSSIQAHVLYRPLGVISGDYYWIHNTDESGSGKGLSIFAVADCTGHGVPGALMSMLGITFLNEIVRNQKKYYACEILHALRANVISTMRYRSTDQQSNDGMDIALGVIDHEAKTLHFAGANRDAHIIRNGEMTVLSGDKMPIGQYIGTHKKFNCSCFALERGDQIYFFTDGYTDQFGGPVNKKYTKRRFKDFLIELSNEQPFVKHCLAIESELNRWQGGLGQIDDVTVMGICWNPTVDVLNEEIVVEAEVCI